MKQLHTPEPWPKFKLHGWPNNSPQIITRKQAQESGFDSESLDWLERKQVVGTENKRRDRLTLYTQQDSIRDAAPELLEVVKALFDWYEQAGYNGNGPSGCSLLFDDDQTLGAHIRAAIAKAEGRP